MVVRPSREACVWYNVCIMVVKPVYGIANVCVYVKV